MSVAQTESLLNLAFFVGTRGRGSNMMAVHQAIQEGRLPARIALVMGSRVGAPAILRAKDTGLPVGIVDPKAGDGSEEAYTDALLTHLRRANVEAIALAGYMRRLPSPVVEAYRHRIVNVHPALLPSFGGKGMYGEHVHRAVLEHGCKVSGCTVHLVDEAYDTGPIVVQRTVPVEEGDTVETLAARILPHEHSAYVEAIRLLAEDRLTVEGRVVHIR